MLITEELLLLLTDDETGKVESGVEVETGLGGALLVDLAAAGRIAFDDDRRGRPLVRVVDATPVGHPLLDHALAELAGRDGDKAQKAVERIGKGARDRTFAALADRGIVRRESGKVLGLFPTTRWPAADGSDEAAVRAELHAALVVGTTPTTRAAALSSLLLALDVVALVVDKADRKQAKARAKEISEGDAAGEGVAAAVKAAQDAAMVAVVAATAASASAAATSS